MSRARETMNRITVLSPNTMIEAAQVLADIGGDAKIIAGGTDLMVALDAGTWRPNGIMLDLSRVSEGRFIDGDTSRIRIGAMTTFADIRRSELIADQAPALAAAAAVVGAEQIQNRATIGGNIMNASPAADSLPALLALGASVTLLSTEGPRVVPLYSFYAGYRRPIAKSTEILIEVSFPRRSKETRDYFRKVGSRRAQTISKVVLSGRVIGVRKESDGVCVDDVRLGIGSVAPTPLRLIETERFIKRTAIDTRSAEEAASILIREITPIDDRRSTAQYRRLVAGRLLMEFLNSIAC